MTAPEFDRGDVPANCFDCQRICSAMGNAARSELNVERYRRAFPNLYTHNVEDYLAILATLIGSAEASRLTAQSIINAYARLSRMYGCKGNNPTTGECQIS